MRATHILGLTSLLLAGQALAASPPPASENFRALFPDAPSAPETSSRVPLRSVMRSLATFGGRVDVSGRGDADYWMRSTLVLDLAKRHMGDALQRLSGATSDPVIQASLRSQGRLLSRSSAGGRGDADYWMVRTNGVAAEIRQAATQLGDMAAAVPTSETLPLSLSLRSMAHLITGVDAGGRGDADYWMRSTELMGKHGVACGIALSKLEASLTGSVRTLVRSLARQLRELDYGGRGDADYWMARASGISRQIKSISQVLHDSAGNF